MTTEQNDNSSEPDTKPHRREISPQQWQIFFLCLVVGIAGILYMFLSRRDLASSALLYVGIPVVLGLGLSLTPRAKSAAGMTLKGITIMLLIVAPLFQEGYICIIFASPIFYAVGLVCAWAVTRMAKPGGTHKVEAAMIVSAFALISLEGATSVTSLPRENRVTVSKVVPASLGSVRSKLSEPLSFSGTKPLFLRIFPYPVSVQGSGLQLGDTRRATFVAYKHIWWNRIEGDAVFSVSEASERKIVFTPVSDSSYVGHYLTWRGSEIDLEPVDDYHTRVTWTLSFHRKYDPSWYFGPLQRYAVRLAAEEFIDHAATPGA